ncbi:MAG: hypothetical protein OXC69_06360 [Candidatus Tectomicrobia bacterium]|nr:hypothetical protein [Candidatus Tectomicrobia bacterium]
MLSMKTLRVAIVTMGSALLLGPGLAAAIDIQLDGKGDNAATPVSYAAETLPAADPMTGGYTVAFPDGDLDLHVKPRRRIDETEDIFIRLDLAGMVIGGAPQLITPTIDADGAVTSIGTPDDTGLSSGGATESFVVFEVGNVALNQSVGIRLQTNGMLTSSSGPVTATISSYSDPDEALDGEFATSSFSGSATVIRIVSGVATTFKPNTTAVASVDAGFLKFLPEEGKDVTSQARLGWLGVQENLAATAGIRNASDGAALGDGNIIDAGGMISFTVMGNLDIGAFSVIDEEFQDAEGTVVAAGTEGAIPSAVCPTGAEGAPDRGTLVDSEGDMLVGEEGELPMGADSGSSGDMTEGIKLLCVNVDVSGADTNMTPIPEAMFTAIAYVKRTADADAMMVGEEGPAGAIRRNGAKVNIPYLTTSEKHNQRLIVVNRGSRDVQVTSIQFNSEAGTEVELSATAQAALDAGLMMIPAGETLVVRMDQALNITGDSRRTAAALGFNGVASNLSVATTQVNLSDGSTDTVVFTVRD